MKPKQLENASRGMTNAKQRLTIVQELAELRENQKQLVEQVNQSFGQVRGSLENITRVLNALVTNVGREAVQATLQQQRVEELEAQGAAVTAAIQASLERGELKVGDVVDNDHAVVVTTQYDAAGTQLYPTMLSVPLDGYSPEVRDLLKGKKVGDEVVLADGGKAVVKAVYVPVPPEERQPPALEVDSSQNSPAGA